MTIDQPVPCAKIGQFTYVLESADGVIDVARRVLVQLFVVAEDDHCHIDRAQDGEFMCLLEKTALPFEERPVLKMSDSLISIDGITGIGALEPALHPCGRVPVPRPFARLTTQRTGLTYTERLRSSLMALISILRLPMMSLVVNARVQRCTALSEGAVVF